MDRLCIITGVSGDLGGELLKVFKKYNYNVLGIDKVEPSSTDGMEFLKFDLSKISTHNKKNRSLIDRINNWRGSKNINVLINNAAYQFVNKNHPIDFNEINSAYNVNLFAPYFLICSLADSLESACGSVINVSSIHAKLTKPGFSIYSSTKAALSMITKSLAIDYGEKFRINCVEPGAINTKMLRAGFENDSNKISQLESFHPQNKIADPLEIAKLIYKIATSEVNFLHGSCIDISGGISSRLHDPE